MQNQESADAYKCCVAYFGPIRAKILDAILDAGENGATCDEIEIATGLKHQTCSAQITFLKSEGLVAYKRDAAGQKVRRNTRSGRPAAVLIVPT
jgi:hypothetical protein